MIIIDVPEQWGGANTIARIIEEKSVWDFILDSIFSMEILI